MDISSVKFASGHNDEFYKTLKKRVNEYFKKENISRHANFQMVFKTIAMLAIYFTPFVLMLTVVENYWLIMLLWMVMGFGMAGIGLSVMHDANHGAYSSKEWVNKLVGNVMIFLGGSDVNWRIQHNILHHTYTNVTGMDEDINPGPSFAIFTARKA